MNEAIDALAEAFQEQKSRADRFEAMSVLDFVLYKFGRFLSDLERPENEATK